MAGAEGAGMQVGQAAVHEARYAATVPVGRGRHDVCSRRMDDDDPVPVSKVTGRDDPTSVAGKDGKLDVEVARAAVVVSWVGAAGEVRSVDPRLSRGRCGDGPGNGQLLFIRLKSSRPAPSIGAGATAVAALGTLVALAALATLA